MEIEKILRLSLREKMHELIETYGQEAIRETAELALKLHPDWLRARKAKKLACPDCGGEDFLAGPCGGLCQNIKCVKCGQEWNDMGPFGLERI